MKLRFLSALMIFISAYSPLAVIFLIQDFDFKLCQFQNAWLIISIFSVALLSCIALYFSVNALKTSSSPIKIVSIASNRSADLINYSIPYLVSFFAVDLNSINAMLSFAFFMVLMFWLTYKTNNIFVNPILIMFGYGLFEVNYLQKQSQASTLMLIKGKKPNKGDNCRIIEISEQLHVITEINPQV